MNTSSKNPRIAYHGAQLAGRQGGAGRQCGVGAARLSSHACKASLSSLQHLSRRRLHWDYFWSGWEDLGGGRGAAACTRGSRGWPCPRAGPQPARPPAARACPCQQRLCANVCGSLLKEGKTKATRRCAATSQSLRGPATNATRAPEGAPRKGRGAGHACARLLSSHATTGVATLPAHRPRLNNACIPPLRASPCPCSQQCSSTTT